MITESGCWIWMKGTDDEGYGNIKINKSVRKVHRVFFELVNNIKLPKHLFVCHRCDITCCINPNHLFVGTAQDNSDDCVAKNRTYKSEVQKGEDNSNAKLVDDDILAIRSKYIPYQYGCKKLAQEYDVTFQLIHKIVTRQIWVHI